MPASFQDRKAKILNELSTPDEQYQDLSPKGSVDEGIRELISEINALPQYVTTSSCAGRIAVYLEGAKGAKGGGQWLFTSHDPVDISDLTAAGALYQRFGLMQVGGAASPHDAADARFVHFKFEPMILHILTANLPAAQHAASAALQAGFRESGINGILDHAKDRQPPTPMVAVRSSGLAFDCIIGYQPSGDPEQCGGDVQPMVSEDYLRTVMGIANQRFKVNAERTERFMQALLRNANATPRG
ncbi:hypothetical protein LTR36_000467 [Oleoguttula mirabilis]|uniref:tRNA(Phe) 7-[(3-amino-3-carboxypropyl)-4-demethylwyosine(37)-N(4)]-methyltransferase n=1 Tax=Oleoguttula mirabilis TaxID=1507867 RepID=A0AAV9JYV3_9PEZI|nr:hypothetical protein LTR36_000467 [Oleoguttula mirabilis]